MSSKAKGPHIPRCDPPGNERRSAASWGLGGVSGKGDAPGSPVSQPLSKRIVPVSAIVSSSIPGKDAASAVGRKISQILTQCSEKFCATRIEFFVAANDQRSTIG